MTVPPAKGRVTPLACPSGGSAGEAPLVGSRTWISAEGERCGFSLRMLTWSGWRARWRAVEGGRCMDREWSAHAAATGRACSLGAVLAWCGNGGARLLSVRRRTAALAGFRVRSPRAVVASGGLWLRRRPDRSPLALGVRLLDRVLGQAGSVVPWAVSFPLATTGRRGCCLPLGWESLP